MPYEIDLPSSLRNNRWKAKIQEKERGEPPHVTIIFKMKKWRWGLRERNFLDGAPPPKEVPKAIIEAIEKLHDKLVEEWDKMYPHNPVESKDER